MSFIHLSQIYKMCYSICFYLGCLVKCIQCLALQSPIVNKCVLNTCGNNKKLSICCKSSTFVCFCDIINYIPK